MTHPLSEDVGTYESMPEEEYKRQTRTAASWVVAACAVGIIFLLAMVVSGGFAKADNRQVSEGVPAAALMADPDTVYPGGDPLAEVLAAFGSLDIFGSLGAVQPELPDPPLPPGDLPLLDDPASVITYCDDNGQATLQVAGVAPLSGVYKITLTPVPELTFTLLDRFMEKGEKVYLVEPVPEGTTIVVALQMPAEPDDGASPFTGALAVPTPVCK